MKYKKHLLNLEGRIKHWQGLGKDQPAYTKPGSEKK